MAARKKVQQNKTTTPVEIQPLKSLVALAAAIEAEAATLAETDKKAGEFAIGTAILGLANRAAFQQVALKDRMDKAKVLAQHCAESLGIARGATEIQRHRSDYSWAMVQLPTYENIYRLCENAWSEIKGSRMPDQHPGKSSVRASAEELTAWLES